VSGVSGVFASMINRYRAERAVSARDESVSWVVVGVVDYALHVEAAAFLAALRGHGQVVQRLGWPGCLHPGCGSAAAWVRRLRARRRPRSRR